MRIFPLAACLPLLAGLAWAETPPPATTTSAAAPAAQSPLTTAEQKLSYSFGVILARNLQEQGAKLDFNSLSLGLKQALEGQPLLMTEEQVLQTLVTYSQERDAAQNKARTELAAKNLAEGNAFAEQNKQRAGVTTLPSGLQYEVLKPGSGKSPTKTDKVSVNYRGTLLDGKEFDSSYKRGKPTSFGVENVIPGWQEAIQLMSPGAHWKIYIPAALAYGEVGVGDIGPNAFLTFEVELLSIEPPAPVK